MVTVSACDHRRPKFTYMVPPLSRTDNTLPSTTAKCPCPATRPAKSPDAIMAYRGSPQRPNLAARATRSCEEQLCGARGIADFRASPGMAGGQHRVGHRAGALFAGGEGIGHCAAVAVGRSRGGAKFDGLAYKHGRQRGPRRLSGRGRAGCRGEPRAQARRISRPSSSTKLRPSMIRFDAAGRHGLGAATGRHALGNKILRAGVEHGTAQHPRR